MTPRERHLLRTYGITEEQYNDLLRTQQDCCAICLRHHSEFKVRLSVDHDHVTKEIRGLLCTHCNRRVIGRHRNPDLMQRAVDYLRQGTGLYVPDKKRKRRVKSKSKRSTARYSKKRTPSVRKKSVRKTRR